MKDITQKIMAIIILIVIGVGIGSIVDNGEFITIPRYKMGGRVKQVILNQELIDMCNAIQKKYRFQMPYNVQFRWNSDMEPVLLEINTRLSGGMHLGFNSGVIIPLLVVGDILAELGYTDKKYDKQQCDVKEIKMTQLETPIILA